MELCTFWLCETLCGFCGIAYGDPVTSQHLIKNGGP